MLVANGDNARELAEKVRKVICEELEGAGGSLESAVVYQRLLEEGVEVPNYQMSAILNAFRAGSLIAVLLRPQREEEVRKHGDLLISGVSAGLCATPPDDASSTELPGKGLSRKAASCTLAAHHLPDRRGVAGGPGSLPTLTLCRSYGLVT